MMKQATQNAMNDFRDIMENLSKPDHGDDPVSDQVDSNTLAGIACCIQLIATINRGLEYVGDAIEKYDDAAESVA